MSVTDCGSNSYCKWYQVPSVCQGSNIPCYIPGQKYNCAGTECVIDPNGPYNSCAEANCAVPKLSCCDASRGVCGPFSGASCPVGTNQVPNCNYCPSVKTVDCCDDSTGTCSTATNVCPNNLRPVDDCTTCHPPPPVSIKCCDPSNGSCETYVNSCPAGLNVVDDCSSCTSPFIPPTIVVNCCNPTLGKCLPFPFGCPAGYNQIPDCGMCPPPSTVSCCDGNYNCNTIQGTSCPLGSKQVSGCPSDECKAPVPPSGSCPRTTCSQGGFPMVFWAEHPGIGVDPTDPAVIQYFRNLKQLICNTNPAGLCVSKFLLRVEYPVDDQGVPNCFYPSTASPLYTELLQYIPPGVTMYIMPYIDSHDPWLAYPDTADGKAYMATQAIPCNAGCSSPPCSKGCPPGYECHNGDCWMPQPDSACDGCGPVQKCYQNPGAKYPKCITLCDAGFCCGNSTFNGKGLCCDSSNPDVTCSNDFAKSVYLAKKWNDVLGRKVFTGIVIDAEGTGWDSGVAMMLFRKAMRQLGVSYKLGTTYDGSKISSGVARLTATDDTRADEMYPEVYNLTTQCSTGDKPWPAGTQLVDSYYNPTLGGCTPVPYPPKNSMYAQAWNTPNPAQTLWDGNGYLNFKTILQNNWSWAQGLTPDVSSRIFPLFSVETSEDSNILTCSYPSGTGGPCGIPNAFGVWNTPAGAQQFINFVKIFSQNLQSILPPGSANIPIENYGIFSVPLLPLGWTGWTV